MVLDVAMDPAMDSAMDSGPLVGPQAIADLDGRTTQARSLLSDAPAETRSRHHPGAGA